MQTALYNILIEKLDEFVRKYYMNQLIKGGIYTGAILFSAIIIFSLLEYFAHFNSFLRGVLFYTFLGVLVFTLFRWIIIPFVKLKKIGPLISYEEASAIIGKHFGEVKDKLLNVLQLNAEYEQERGNVNLLAASVDQKINELKPVPFDLAIDFKANRKYIKYLAFPAIVLLVLGLSEPDLILRPSERIVRYSSDFKPKAPFDFIIPNKQLTVVKNEDFNVSLIMKGETLPNEVYIAHGDRRAKLDKKSKTEFSFEFRNMQESTSFRFYADGFYSGTYTVEVLPNPLLLGFKVMLKFPAYLKQEAQEVNNIGDLTVPEGTQVTWSLSTENTNHLTISFDENQAEAIRAGKNNFTHSITALNSAQYTIHTSNEYHKNSDLVKYMLEVVKDRHPEIGVVTERDSLNEASMHFFGRAGDDHGLRSLTFNYRRVDDANEESDKFASQPLSFDAKSLETTFYYHLNTRELGLSPGNEIEYYFEVSDNDGVNGSKYSRTPVNRYKLPTVKELEKKIDKGQEKMKEELASAMKDAKKIKEELAELSRKLVDKKQAGWQDKELLNTILEKQKSLKNKIREIQDKYQENNKLSNDIRPNNDELLEKQNQLQELMESLMTEEMKQQMEEIQSLLENIDKEKLKEEVEKMQLSSEDLEKELDRSLELFKRMELEAKLQEAMEDLEKLKNEQDKLSEETENAKGKELEEKATGQNELNKDFRELKEKIADLEKKNGEMEFPVKMEDMAETQEGIEEQMNEGLENMEKGKPKKAQENQEKASDGMQELSNALSMMKQNMMKKQEEDINALRQLLENIITSSFEQEDLMGRMEKMSGSDPNYVAAMVDQKSIRDNVKLVEDSLFALSKRVVQLQSIVNKEINAINYNIDNAIKEMQERRTDLAGSRQQLAMTSLNNLALLLDEVIQQMQMQMAMEMPGKGSCDKPGGKGKPKPGSMSDMQKMLNDQLKSLKEGMKPGEGNPKGTGNNADGGKMSQELARMAARQAALREELNKMAGQNENAGQQGEMKKLSELMEQTETDIVNKRITRETLKRQEEILTRLLDSEKAEREREWDNKRESQEHTMDLDRNRQKLLEYFKKNQNEVELLRTMIPSYNEFYKRKVSEYFKLLAE